MYRRGGSGEARCNVGGREGVDGAASPPMFEGPVMYSGVAVLGCLEESPVVLEAAAEGVKGPGVAKMASHAIFQYNVLAIDDTHTTLGLIYVLR